VNLLPLFLLTLKRNIKPLEIFKLNSLAWLQTGYILANGYIDDVELQVITALSLIYTIHKSLQQPLILSSLLRFHQPFPSNCF
jgi:hypothetical protein